MTLPTVPEQSAIAYLRSPQAIRDRCLTLFHLCQQDQLLHFRCHLDRLGAVADYVAQVMQAVYPDGEIPFHSRWRHFEVGGMERLASLQAALAPLSPVERAKAQFDLAIASVLLDAGAGDQWHYQEATTGQTWSRSEGLAVASFHLFCAGAFGEVPYQVTATGLQNLSEAELAQGFQVSETNPLVGLTGRWELLQRLGRSLHQFPAYFGSINPRPGNLVDYLLGQVADQQLSATTVFQAVLDGLGDIWPGRVAIAGVNLGDTWFHPLLSATGPGGDLVPFHKLSQWLTYSLLEPLQELGLQITDLDALTGLPEYRNGGLLLDLGLLEVKNPEIHNQSHLPGSSAIVEWRSLTVICLDLLADTLRQRLHQSATELPLVKILQGGTWSAGRKIAAQLRPRGGPPLQIASDGTVF